MTLKLYGVNATIIIKIVFVLYCFVLYWTMKCVYFGCIALGKRVHLLCFVACIFLLNKCAFLLLFFAIKTCIVYCKLYLFCPYHAHGSIVL